jgi:hypothetical protein
VLIMKRRRDQWIHITHKSGDVIKIRIHKLHGPASAKTAPATVRLAFLDEARNFEIHQGFDGLQTEGATG